MSSMLQKLAKLASPKKTTNGPARLVAFEDLFGLAESTVVSTNATVCVYTISFTLASHPATIHGCDLRDAPARVS